MKKLYLCVEHGEEFTVEAESLEQAREYAAEWGGEAIGEYKERSHIYYKDFDKAISFGFNYPHNFWFEVWKDQPLLADHLHSKFQGIYKEKGNGTVAFFYFWNELDDQNRKVLVDWINENFEWKR